MRCLLLLALPGCLLGSPVDTTTHLGVYSVPTIVGPAGAVALRVTESYGTVHIDASRSRRCYDELRETVAHRPSQGVWGAGVGFSLSGLAAVGAETSYEDRSVRVTASDCPVVARHATVELVLPSGDTIRAATNAQGVVSVAVPVSEPPQGTVIVRSAHSEVRIAYSRQLAVAAAPAWVDSQPPASRRP
jgi:hypothetical protein